MEEEDNPLFNHLNQDSEDESQEYGSDDDEGDVPMVELIQQERNKKNAAFSMLNMQRGTIVELDEEDTQEF